MIAVSYHSGFNNGLPCLIQSYISRLQTLTAGPESYMNIKKSLSEIDLLADFKREIWQPTLEYEIAVVLELFE